MSTTPLFPRHEVAEIKVALNEFLDSIEQEDFENIPEFLTHYTNVSAVDKIIDGKEIWASDIKCMNDSTELDHAFRVGLKHKIFDNIPNNELLIKYIEDSKIQPNVVVACFSEDSDLLGQWRAYGNYAMPFSSRKLADATTVNEGGLKLRLARCRYEESDKMKLLEDAIKAAEKFSSIFQYPPRVRKDGSEEILGPEYQFPSMVLSFIRAVSPLMKDPAFRDEREWRLFTLPIGFDELKIRISGDRMIPYIPLPLNGQIADILNSVTIGPQLDFNSARTGIEVKSYQVGGDLSGFEVLPSKIPYVP